MSKRAIRILCFVAIVLVAGYFGLREAVRSMHVSFGYCVEAEFESLPPDDFALVEWMKLQGTGEQVAPDHFHSGSQGARTTGGPE
jgi:hypothetical protein